MPLSLTSTKVIKPLWPSPLTGRLYGSLLSIGALATGAVAIDTLYATPIGISLAVTLTVLGIEVTTGAAGNVRIGIYRYSAGAPGALLVDSGAISTATPAAFKSAAISLAIVPDVYCLTAVFSATPTVRMLTAASCLHGLGSSSGTDTNIHAGISVAFTYAALPDPFPAGSALYTGNFPNLLFGP